jgi:carboxylesterase type B
VALQLVSPGSRGLYHRAIVQSADRATTRLTTHDQSLATGDAFAIAIGCTDPQQVVACMRSKTFNQVLTAMPVGTLQVVSPPNRVYWEPIVDGIVVLDQPRVLFEQGALERVPTIVGVNRDEGWGSFTSQFITQSFPTGVEANILFGNNYGPPIFPNHPLSGADESLHGAMSGYWTRFAATGNPNSDDGAAIHWPAFKHPLGVDADPTNTSCSTRSFEKDSARARDCAISSNLCSSGPSWEHSRPPRNSRTRS